MTTATATRTRTRTYYVRPGTLIYLVLTCLKFYRRPTRIPEMGFLFPKIGENLSATRRLLVSMTERGYITFDGDEATITSAGTDLLIRSATFRLRDSSQSDGDLS